VDIETILILSLLKLNINKNRAFKLSWNFDESPYFNIEGYDKELKENGNYERSGVARPYYPFRRNYKLMRMGRYSKMDDTFKRFCLNNVGVNRKKLKSILYPTKEVVINFIERKLVRLPKDKRRSEAIAQYKELDKEFEIYKKIPRKYDYSNL